MRRYSFTPRGATGGRIGIRAQTVMDQPYAVQREAARARRNAAIARDRTNAAIAAAAMAPRQLQVYGRPNPQEIKFYDTVAVAPVITNPYGLYDAPNSAAAEPTAAFTGITEINNVIQGAGAYNRVGQKIVMQSVALKMNLHALCAAVGTTNGYLTARIMIIYDRQTNGAFPAIGDILSANITTAPNLTSGLNMAKKSRFSIVADQYYDFGPHGTTTATVAIFRNKLNLETEFGAASTPAVIGDITTGSLLVVAFATRAGIATNYCTFTDFSARIRFNDA